MFFSECGHNLTPLTVGRVSRVPWFLSLRYPFPCEKSHPGERKLFATNYTNQSDMFACSLLCDLHRSGLVLWRRTLAKLWSLYSCTTVASHVTAACRAAVRLRHRLPPVVRMTRYRGRDLNPVRPSISALSVRLG